MSSVTCPGACAPSITVRMPAAAARRQISATGKRIAVTDVMWLRKITLVCGVTPCHNCATSASSDPAGKSIGWRM